MNTNDLIAFYQARQWIFGIQIELQTIKFDMVVRTHILHIKKILTQFQNDGVVDKAHSTSGHRF